MTLLPEQVFIGGRDLVRLAKVSNLFFRVDQINQYLFGGEVRRHWVTNQLSFVHINFTFLTKDNRGPNLIIQMISKGLSHRVNRVSLKCWQIVWCPLLQKMLFCVYLYLSENSRLRQKTLNYSSAIKFTRYHTYVLYDHIYIKSINNFALLPLKLL